MMGTIKLTTKRQATFPVEVCKSLGIEPGDELEVIPVVNEDGERVWQLKKAGQIPERVWVGCLNQYAQNVEDHSMDAIRKSVIEERSLDGGEK